MATEQIFREMQHHLQTLQEALEALSTTVDEDKPTRDDVVVASRLSDDLLAVRGLFEETRSAADDALLAGYATGDPDASVAFVRRHQRRVYGLAISVVGNPGTAEDVAQEAFTRAWRHASTYDSRRGSVPTWLLTITRNLAIDAIRMRRARPVDPEVMAALAMEATGPGSSPSGAAEASATHSR